MIPHKLSKGSPRLEPIEPGKLRLYSCPYCPYAHRVRIVLNAKNIQHEVVDIDLSNKPEWFSEVNSEGKVPTLETSDEIVVESLDISDFLDQKYTQPPLYSTDPERQSKEKQLIKHFGKAVISQMFPAYRGVEGVRLLEEGIKHFMEEFGAELQKRGTTFFNGNSPGMVEYMVYPWLQRMTLPFSYNEVEFTFPEGELFNIVKHWMKALEETDAIKKTPSDMTIYLEAVKKLFPKEN